MRNNNINSWSNGPTVREIAEQAGVSIATVSRVINSNTINPKSKNQLKIKRILDQTGYIKQKKGNVSGSLLCIGNATIDTQGFDPLTTHYPELEHEMEAVALQQGFDLLISRTLTPREHVFDILQRMKNFSGVFFLGVSPAEGVTLPTVVVNQNYLGREYSSIDYDFIAGFIETLSYLKKLGHKRIGFFYDHRITDDPLHYAIHSLPQAYIISGLEYDEKLLWNADFPPQDHQETVCNAVDYFLSMEDSPTAIALISDVYVPSFYEVLRDRGLSIPEDISVVGHKCLPMSSKLVPRLTTTSNPVKTIAEAAMNMMRSLINDSNQSPQKRIYIKPELIIGKSCAKANR